MRSLKEKLINLIQLMEFGLPEKDIMNNLIDIVYEEYQDQTLNLFLVIQERDKKRIKKDNQILYQGLESSICNESMVNRHLLEDKNSRNAKDSSKYIFENEDGNIAYLINQMKAYFPNGKSDGASNSGKWFYNKFVSLLQKNKEKYLEGGEFYNWTIIHEHADYIKLILSENEQTKIQNPI